MLIPYISYRQINCGCVMKKFVSSIIRYKSAKLSYNRHLSTEQKKENLCSAYSTCETYDLSEIRKYFSNKVYAPECNTAYTLANLPKDASDVLYIKTSNTENETGHVFIFRRLGSFVCWNVSKSEVWFLKKVLSQHEKSPFSLQDTHEVSEELNFFSTNGASNLTDGDIYLSNQSTEENQALEKMAFSNAVALSVKLDVWEIALDRFSGSLRHIPERLKHKKKINISRGEIMEKIGELLSLRHQINLYSDILTTPDFYWNHEELERLYSKTCSYLEISKRTKVMNSKMDLCSELVEMLRSHLNDEHSHRLEWMIIILIVFEVIFEMLHLITRWSEK